MLNDPKPEERRKNKVSKKEKQREMSTPKKTLLINYTLLMYVYICSNFVHYNYFQFILTWKLKIVPHSLNNIHCNACLWIYLFMYIDSFSSFVTYLYNYLFFYCVLVLSLKICTTYWFIEVIRFSLCHVLFTRTLIVFSFIYGTLYLINFTYLFIQVY